MTDDDKARETQKIVRSLHARSAKEALAAAGIKPDFIVKSASTITPVRRQILRIPPDLRKTSKDPPTRSAQSRMSRRRNRAGESDT